MKVICIEGYLREGGNTAKLTDLVINGLRERGHSVDVVGLRERSITDCLNCGGCAETRVCVLDDDMTPLYEKILSADAIVLSSPIYMWHITAQLKAFVDRFYCMTEQLSGKKLGLILTAGGDAFDGLHLAVDSFKFFADYTGMPLINTLYRAPVENFAQLDPAALKADTDAFCEKLTADAQ